MRRLLSIFLMLSGCFDPTQCALTCADAGVAIVTERKCICRGVVIPPDPPIKPSYPAMRLCADFCASSERKVKAFNDSMWSQGECLCDDSTPEKK